MSSNKLKRVAWFLPVLLGLALLITFLLLLPQLTKAQSSVEFTVSPVEQTVLPGSTPQFAITITNTGAISLTNIIVEPEAMRPTEADFLRNCRKSPIGTYNIITGQTDPITLDIGESYSYNCSEPLLYQDVQQTLLLSAEAIDNSSTVSDSQAVSVHVEHLSANFGTENQAVTYGDSASLTLFIANSGDYDLTNISVTPRDAAFANCTRAAGQLPDLPGGQAITLNCASANIFDDIEVIFDVAATLDGSTAVSEVAYTLLDSVKGLELEIAPDEQMIPANTTADLTLTLRNPDNVTATDLTVTSPDFPACNKAIGSLPDLAGGESYQYLCQTPKLGADNTYTLTASATTNNLAVKAVANTTINANSQVAIAVSPSYLITTENAPVTFTITVTNNLTDTLTSVAVNNTSSVASRSSGTTTDCARSLADLAPGEVVTYTCQGTAVPGEPYQSFVLSGFTPSEFADRDDYYHLAQANAYAGLTYTYLPVAMNNYQRPYTLPDLTITNLTVSQISNTNYSINITVKNPSTLPVAVGNNFFVNAYLTSDLNSPIFVCSVQGQWMGAGQTYTCSGQITLAPGSHVVRAWADPYGNVTEEYESNNTRDLEVTDD